MQQNQNQVFIQVHLQVQLPLLRTHLFSAIIVQVLIIYRMTEKHQNMFLVPVSDAVQHNINFPIALSRDHNQQAIGLH